MAAKRERKKRKRRVTAASTRRKLLAEWSVAVRTRDGYACVVCGASQHTQSHHLIPKERFNEYQYEIDNGVTLCPSHHKFGKFSAHSNALWFAAWIRANRHAQYEWAMERLDTGAK